VLAIGNFMNFGTRGGQTVGFDISSLTKLVETRANNRTHGTLLHFVIQTIRTKYPESMQFTQELADLKYAKNGNFISVNSANLQFLGLLHTINFGVFRNILI
jgi:hypothetical protein